MHRWPVVPSFRNGEEPISHLGWIDRRTSVERRSDFQKIPRNLTAVVALADNAERLLGRGLDLAGGHSMCFGTILGAP